MYTIEKAELISEQLRKFKDGYAHHASGHFGNIDFWIKEVLDALKAIDEHKLRFERLKINQQKWVDAHDTIVQDFCGICGGRCEFDYNGGYTPSPPKRKLGNEMKQVRIDLVNSAYYLLIKFYKQNLIDKNQLKDYCIKIGTSIDVSDL